MFFALFLTEGPGLTTSVGSDEKNDFGMKINPDRPGKDTDWLIHVL